MIVMNSITGDFHLAHYPTNHSSLSSLPSSLLFIHYTASTCLLSNPFTFAIPSPCTVQHSSWLVYTRLVLD